MKLILMEHNGGKKQAFLHTTLLLKWMLLSPLHLICKDEITPWYFQSGWNKIKINFSSILIDILSYVAILILAMPSVMFIENIFIRDLLGQFITKMLFYIFLLM